LSTPKNTKKNPIKNARNSGKTRIMPQNNNNPNPNGIIKIKRSE
jgi:hypothetical protein